MPSFTFASSWARSQILSRQRVENLLVTDHALRDQRLPQGAVRLRLGPDLVQALGREDPFEGSSQPFIGEGDVGHRVVAPNLVRLLPPSSPERLTGCSKNRASNRTRSACRDSERR